MFTSAIGTRRRTRAPWGAPGGGGGTSIRALQALLGHKSAVETWDTYGHLMGDEDDRSRAVIQEQLSKNCAQDVHSRDP